MERKLVARLIAGCSPYHNSATTIPTASLLHHASKNRGITIAVLYIPYETIQNATTFANSEDIYANDNIPQYSGGAADLRLAQFLSTPRPRRRISTTR